MVRLFRMSILAIAAVLVLAIMQVDVSAKKKSSKRKSRAARSARVIVISPVRQSLPVIIKGPVLSPVSSPVVADDFRLSMSAPGPGTSTSSGTGNGSSGGSAAGDADGKSRNLWVAKPSIRMAGALIISEFRLTGPNGFNDEFIEIYNDFGTSHTVAASSGSGYGIAASDGIPRCIIPNGTTIPARGHYLCVNSVGYSLSTYPSGNDGASSTTATGDATYTTGITDGEDPDGMGGLPATARQGIALFTTSIPANFSIATRFDAVGPTSEANTLYREGAGLPNLTSFTSNQAWVRDECGKGGALNQPGPCTISTPKDTDINAADFFYVDTVATDAGAGRRLGAPGPQNLTSPIQRNSSITEHLLDSTVPRQNPPNRVRDFTSDPANNSTFGTLHMRRRFVNNTGASITRLRFRIVDLDTFPSVAGFADLRARNSTAVTISSINDPATCTDPGDPAPCTVLAQGTTLDVSTLAGTGQLNGGAFNSSMSAGTVTLNTPLANGASINLVFLFGLQQTGNFKVYVHLEALP